MDFGLTEKTLELIKQVFVAHPEIQQVKIFGSRALGNYRNNSDIDLVIMDDIDERLLGILHAELDDLPLPYLFDVQIYQQITHDGLRQHIIQHAKILYEKRNY